MFLSMPEDGNNLLIASEAGDLDAIQKLYGQNRDVLLVRTFERDTPLHIAARNGHPNLVKWILKKKRCLSKARNNDENTPLHEAAKSGSRDVVQIFLQLEQSYFCRYNKFGETALVIASQHGHVGIVESLLEARSDDLFEWDRSLREAAYRGYKDVVLAMLDKAPKCFFPQFIHDLSRIWMLGLEVEVEDIPETPILHVAVQGGQVESVRAMLNHRSWRNVSMTEMDEYGRCAIHVAAMKGYWEIINEFMLRMSDSADIHSSDHKSVLHFAVEYNQIEVVENLLANRTPERAAEMVSRDHDGYGNTALHLAAMNGSRLQGPQEESTHH